MPSTSIDRRIALRHSRAWLWWRYINYGGRDLYGILILMLGLPPLTLTTAILVAIASNEIPYWLHGQVTEGTITGKSGRVVRGGKGRARTVYDQLSYVFADGAGTHQQGGGTVSRQSWDSASIGGKISIEYLPADPKRNRPVREHGELSGVRVILAMFLGCGVLPTLFGAAKLIVGLKTLGHRVRLIESGQATAGLVERVEATGEAARRPLAYECSYRYLIPAQDSKPAQTMRGSVILYPRQATMRPGDVVLVVFDPEQPQEHAVDIHHARWEEPEPLLPAMGAWPAEKSC